LSEGVEIAKVRSEHGSRVPQPTFARA